VRPERSRLTSQPADGFALPATVRRTFYLGANREVHVDFANGEKGVVEIRNDGTAVDYPAGTRVWLAAGLGSCRVLPAKA
jgi:hypothetical protein